MTIMKHSGYNLLLILLGVLLPSVISAQMPLGRDKVQFEPVDTLVARIGDTVSLRLRAKIETDYYTYGAKRVVTPDGLGPERSRVSIATPGLFAIVGAVGFPKGKKYYDEVWEAEVEKWEGRLEFQFRLSIGSQISKAENVGKIRFLMQICDSLSCLPLDTIMVDIPLRITGELASGSSAVEQPATMEVPDIEDETPSSPVAYDDAQAEIVREQNKGPLSFFFFAMGVGFLALLTPCVFPMIPITVSFFTKRHEKHRSKALRDASLYAVGIISTFTGIGIVASLIFGATAVQDLAANPWLNLSIGVLFVVLAFNLFGAFEIQVPTSIMNALNRKSQGSGTFSVLMMGLTFSLTSFTCTVPFVGTALLTATRGEFFLPVVGMLGFATSFALPFFFLALFPSILARLPKAGGWMNNLKVVMGFLEIAAAVKFFSTAEFVWGFGILPRETFLAVWTGVCALVTVYLLGGFSMKLDSVVERVSGLRVSFAIFFASLTFLFAAGMLGVKMPADLEALLPPDNYHELLGGAPAASAGSFLSVKGKTTDHSQWLTDLDVAKKLASETNKPIFIDFTGFACVNCRLMEKEVFTKSAVQEVFERFVLVQLYTDKKTEPYITNQQIMAGYGTVANPLYVLLKPDGSYIAQTGYQPKYRNSAEEFISFLNQAF